VGLVVSSELTSEDHYSPTWSVSLVVVVVTNEDNFNVSENLTLRTPWNIDIFVEENIFCVEHPSWTWGIDQSVHHFLVTLLLDERTEQVLSSGMFDSATTVVTVLWARLLVEDGLELLDTASALVDSEQASWVAVWLNPI
jgi:hypothetical protein